MKTCPACHSSYPPNYTVCPVDSAALVEVGTWSEGTVVRGKYQILAKVGQGGMGSVYKALHVHFEELRALKVMSPEFAADPLFVRRFKQEAVITRKLQHSNAVRVEDIDQAEDGRPFIVMEYIEGHSLKDVIQQEAPMPVARGGSTARQVASALDVAHRLGMVHRDIKPANNLLVTTSDSGPRPVEAPPLAKVLDFGIAKIKEVHLQDAKMHPTTLTGTGMVIGTPAYMSPEQAMGKRGDELDGRSDLYSLGVVIYQMLAGELPLKADSEIQLMMAHINVPPTPIRDRHPEIPEPIASLVMKCLEKNREQRPASGSQLIELLDRAETEAARPP